MLTPAYELVYEEELKDSRSQGVMLRHKKSGARICVLANDDENKVFSVGFRTPPKDSTGVAHIIEHTVLCGSEKYPLKDPFVELIKGSLNTFLNAFTWPDHTLYPVASCNTQDFKNLMSVYMDAVFHPNIYHYEEIFMQEGWHYEVGDDGNLAINGVVYNEMKGAFSSPDQVLYRGIMHSLYPDNAYGVESGGDPENIPDLTYENYLDFHRKFYHPVNSYIFLYGNMDVKERLTWLDSEYLSKYDAIEVDSTIAYQKPFGQTKEFVTFYPVAEGEDTAGKTYLSYNMMIGDSCDTKLCTAMGILNRVLLSPVGSLYQALVKAGISPNIMSNFDEGVQQPFFSIIAKDTDEEKKEEFLNIIKKELTRIVEEGVPERSLRAEINIAEFKYREADYGYYPKGLMMNMMMFATWLYNDDKAFEYLRCNDLYAELKKEIGTGYYEELIRKYLLNPEHATVFIMKPEAGLTGKMEKKLKDKLLAYRETLTEEDIALIKQKQEGLKKYQDTPDSKEVVETLPRLERSDVKREALPILTKERAEHGTVALTQEVFTNGIAYVQLMFDANHLTKEQVPYLGLLTTVLGYVDSENYTYQEFDNEMKIGTGGVYTSVETYQKDGDVSYYRPAYVFSAKAMYDQLPKAYELINEMIHCTKWEDVARLKDIVLELRSKKQMELMRTSHSVAVRRALACQYEKSVFLDQINGIAYYRFLSDLADNFDGKVMEVMAQLKNLCAALFRKENLFVSITAEEEGINKALAGLKGVADLLPGKNREGDIRFCPANYGFVLKKEKEAFTCPGQVQYVAKCGTYADTGIKTNGAMSVMNKILSMDYFWDKVRVHGGAYGCLCNFDEISKSYSLVSYRDPNLKETIEVFDRAWEYLRDFDADEREMTKFIIGTSGDLDAPLSPRMLGRRSFNLYLMGTTFEEVQRLRDERIDATPEDIRAYAPLFKAVMEQDCLCVVGSEAKIADAKELFDKVEALV